MYHSSLCSLRFAALALIFHVSRSYATFVDPAVLDACSGYSASNIVTSGAVLTADLLLNGNGCNVFGPDIKKLGLRVVYETNNRIHVKFVDTSASRYEVPESVFPRPTITGRPVSPPAAAIQFNFTTSPFSFSIFRTASREVLFSTVSHPIIFEPQYLRVKTRLPTKPNIYGLGEHSNPFRLPSDNTTITLWSRDAADIPARTNLYGNHPIYFEHRMTGTHGVFLLNSNGMDIKLTTVGGSTALEYNVIGGVLDFYFLAGSTSDPTAVARQYAEVAGTPAEVPYWTFGLHQCRFGYKDFVDVAGVITNYSAARIPLETMWADIDYMDRRRIFTVDPAYFPLDRMQEIVSHLHANGQKFILMNDPAMPFLPGEGFGPFDRGTELDVWLKAANGSYGLALVWPGVTVYPDWFHPNIAQYWNREFELFYDPLIGLDIDGVWIDMNEPSNFCDLPCTDPFEQAKQQNLPPPRSSPPPNHDTPIFVNSSILKAKRDDSFNPPYALNNAAGPLSANTAFRDSGHANLLVEYVHNVYGMMMYTTTHNAMLDRCPGLHTQVTTLSTPTLEVKRNDILNPPYAINNAAGPLSAKTAFMDSKHANGLVEYDVHNLYGTMMSTATQDAMLARRPGLRTLVITRSTFAGAGNKVGKWLGDNVSLWDHYRISIAGMLGFATIYQVPMVGSDICGFNGNTTANLCARWAMLGAFYPFMRNHNSDSSISQEFYRFDVAAQAARNALDIRQIIVIYNKNYIYTAFHQAHLDGTPVLHPLWFKYPKDPATFSLDLQFFYGDSILVSPVTQEDSTSVTIYLPRDNFFDFTTLAPVRGTGSTISLTNVSFTQIPLHIKGGTVLPLRSESAMTTNELRERDFEFVVAPGMDGAGAASGALYVDDGVSVDPQPGSSTFLKLTFKNKRLDVQCTIGFKSSVKVSGVRFLGVTEAPRSVRVNGRMVGRNDFTYDGSRQVLDVVTGLPLTGPFNVQYA